MKTIKYLAIAASALLLAVSCQKTLEKAEVEKGFAPKGAVPTSTINTSDFKIVEAQSYAEVTASFSGITSDMDSLEIGFLVSTDPDFTSSTSYLIENPADGTFTQQVKVKIGTINYVKAFAGNTDGASFSETLALDVPTVEWYKVLAGKYTADVYSYWDEGACSYEDHVLEIAFDLDAKKMTINNIDPWAYPQGVPTSLTGDVDLEARTVTFVSETGYFDTGLSGYGFITYALDPAALNEGNLVPVAEMTFKFSEDGQQISAPVYCTYSIKEGNSGTVDIYLPQIYSAVSE